MYHFETSGIRWRRILALLAVAFAARAVVTVAIAPPMEGWDEYQHVAYLVHLDEHDGEAPRLGTANVSPRLLEKVVAFPVPLGAREQLIGAGGVGHAAFWRGEARYREGHPPVRLYQAQHASFYYRLALPLFRAAGGIDDLRTSVAVLRLANALLGFVALALVVLWIARWFPNDRLGVAIAAAVALNPLFLVNVCRVANDALAIALVTAGICGTLAAIERGGLWRVALAGVFLGAATFAKTLAAPAIPWAVVALACAPGRTFRWRAGTASLAAGLAAVVLAPFVLDSLTHYGTLTPMQEAVANERAGAGLGAWWGAIVSIDWWQHLRTVWTDGGLWASGWSGILPRERFRVVIGIAVGLGLVGLVARAVRQRRLDPAASVGLGLAAWTSAAMAYHMIQTRLAWGVVATGAHYAAFALPWWQVSWLGGARALAARWQAPVVGAVAVIFTIVEVRGLGRSAVEYSGTERLGAAFERLERLHPAWLGSEAVALGVAIWAVALVGLAFVAVTGKGLRYRCSGTSR